MVIDTGHLVAWDTRLSYSVGKSGSGWIASWLSGEGLVCHFQGQGQVYVQSRNAAEYVDPSRLIDIDAVGKLVFFIPVTVAPHVVARCIELHEIGVRAAQFSRTNSCCDDVASVGGATERES